MEIKEKVITEIKKIYDPEIPVNIYELGLIYDVTVAKTTKTKQTPQAVKKESKTKSADKTSKKTQNKKEKK